MVHWPTFCGKYNQNGGDQNRWLEHALLFACTNIYILPANPLHKCIYIYIRSFLNIYIYKQSSRPLNKSVARLVCSLPMVMVWLLLVGDEGGLSLRWEKGIVGEDGGRGGYYVYICIFIYVCRACLNRHRSALLWYQLTSRKGEPRQNSTSSNDQQHTKHIIQYHTLY